MSGFSGNSEKMAHKLVDASIELHRLVMNNFLPSAVKFFYQFNLRDMTSITQVRWCAACVQHQAGGWV